MTALSLLLALYFGATFGISGLAKLDQGNDFAYTLWAHQILPIWAIRVTSRLFPVAELLLAAALIWDVWRPLTAVLLFGCCTGFLIFKTFLLLCRPGSDCGCYGRAERQRADRASLITSLLMLLLAGLYFLLVFHQPIAVPKLWRLGSATLLSGVGAWIGSRMWLRYQWVQRRREAVCVRPAPTSIQVVE